MHQPRNLALVFVKFLVVVVHGDFGFFVVWRHNSAQEVAETVNAFAAEDAEELALLLRELWRRVAAEGGQFITEELLHARETEVCEARTVLEKRVDSLIC